MKIVLLEDVKSLGKKGEIVEVAEGYARNFILPKKKGVEATSSNLNTLKLQKANAQKIENENIEAAKALAAKLNETSVSLKIKGGEGGRTFGSVTSKEIAAALKSQHDLDVDKKIMLGETIKTFGTHEVDVKIYKGINAKLKVKVDEE